MEKQLFDYTELQEACAECFGFSGVTTKVPIGNIPIGTKFDNAWIHLEDMVLELYNGNDCDNPRRFNLSVVPGTEIMLVVEDN